MYLKKGICFLLLAAAILTTAVGLDRCQRNDWGKTQAEGGAPPAPPIPWSAALDSPCIIAEGGAPPAPPIPWGVAGTDIKFLRA